MKPNVIIILGPTASGKTKLAAHLAKVLNSEIISADSRQVYRDMNIGTGKDYSEYTFDGYTIPTHLIDIKEAGEKYHIDAFKKDFFNAFETIQTKGLLPIVCGGTGLYIEAVLRNFVYTSVPVDPLLRNILLTQTREELLQQFSRMPDTPFSSLADTSTVKRLIRAIEINTYLLNNTFEPSLFPELQPIIIGLNPPTTIRRQNISLRLKQRLQDGLIEEVQQLLTRIPAEELIYYGLEYKFVTLHLQGKLSLLELQDQLTTAIQQFAKRQMTYFRKMERDGMTIHWINTSVSLEEQLDEVVQLLG